MSDRSVLDPDERSLVDTNLFVAIGPPGNPKFDQFRAVVRSSNVVLSVPERVRDELTVHPNERRLSTALEEGWAEIVSPPPATATEAISAIDRVRREIATLTSCDEHEVEKADTVFAGLAVEYLSRGDDRVTVLTDDGPAATAIERAVDASDVHGTVRVLTLDDVIDVDDTDGVKLI